MGLFDGSIGAFLSGTIISTFLLGVTATQAYYYYNNFPNDRRLYFWMVTGMLVLDWSHTIISCITVYEWTVVSFGDLAQFINCPWTFAVDPAMTGVAASVVQFFYAYRVWVVAKRKNPIIPIAIAVLSLVQLGFACGATGMIFYLQKFSRFSEWTYGVSIWLGAAAACDILITVSLIYYLVKGKSGILQTNSVCNRLIQLVVEANGLTAACAVIDAILFGAMPNDSWHATFNLMLVKLYFNSLLVSLNARVDLEKRLIHGNPRSGSAANGALSPHLITASGFTAADLGSSHPFTKLHPVRVTVNTLQTVTSESVDKADYEKYSAGHGARNQVAAADMRRKESDASFSSGDVTV